jgi:hypothetical protein
LYNPPRRVVPTSKIKLKFGSKPFYRSLFAKTGLFLMLQKTRDFWMENSPVVFPNHEEGERLPFQGTQTRLADAIIASHLIAYRVYEV